MRCQQGHEHSLQIKKQRAGLFSEIKADDKTSTYMQRKKNVKYEENEKHKMGNKMFRNVKML